jgi:arsenite/tail-anchored protein-transporting ATPase
MNNYDSLNLAMFSGKGGVGKTTISCAFARRWAQLFTNEQILLISTDPAHSLGDILQTEITDDAHSLSDLPNLQVRCLNSQKLLQDFKGKYGDFLELLVERGSFVEGEDLTPVWDLSWPGLDELMGLLEIQRLLTENEVDRIVVDMSPSGHTLNLFAIKDFLDVILSSLELFQEKHRVVTQTFAGKYTADEVDNFLVEIKDQLTSGKSLLQNQLVTACLVVAIAEPMSLAETQRFIASLIDLQIPCGGIFINRIITDKSLDLDVLSEQQLLLKQFLELDANLPLFIVPKQSYQPLGFTALDNLLSQTQKLNNVEIIAIPQVTIPNKILPSFTNFLAEKRKLILIGGKGGVGKTTIAAAIGWSLSQQYPEQKIRMISIDPAHSLGDAFGVKMGNEPLEITANLSGQEVDAQIVLDKFRDDYLWELAEMISGETSKESSVKIAYSPQAWRQIVAQALPGIDEMLSLITVMDLLESNQQDLIILDTAPTGHLLRFLEMPTALGEWLAWIFKLWMKYQNVLGKVDLMGRLRTLRKQVMSAQKLLQNPNFTEFIGVVQNESAIIAEQVRLGDSLQKMGIYQRYLVHNKYQSGSEIDPHIFPSQTLIKLPILPRSVPPKVRVEIASKLLF